MVSFTMVDYWRYQNKFPIRACLNETKEEYKLEKTHQYQDKIFKEIFEDKLELLHFIRNYTTYEEEENKLKETDIEKYNPKFITNHFRNKESDVIYKVKEKDVFILIEHQSTIDYQMAERILEYCVELVRCVTKRRSKNILYPLIFPIVLYTGKKKWDAPLSISEKQESFYGFEPLDYPKYNLMDIHDYTIEEFIEDKTAIAKAMLFEKVKSKEEVYEKMIEGGEKNMSNFEKLMIEILDERNEKCKLAEEKGKEEGKKEGVKEGKREGIREGIASIAKKMIERKMELKEIEEITGLSSQELKGLA